MPYLLKTATGHDGILAYLNGILANAVILAVVRDGETPEGTPLYLIVYR